jgi:hypothetical protein
MDRIEAEYERARYMQNTLMRRVVLSSPALEKDLRSVYKMSSPITDHFCVFFGDLAVHSIVTDISKILSIDQPAMKLRIQSSSLCKFTTEGGDYSGMAAI